MSSSTLDEVLEQLYAVRDEVYGAVAVSVRTQLRMAVQLDGVIRQLEEKRDENPRKLDVQAVLALFGKALEALPAVARLIEQLRSGL